MKIRLAEISKMLKITKPIVMSDRGEHFFILIHESGGSIYPQMIKLFGKELEVEENINPGTYIYKEYIDDDDCYIEIKIRNWMIEDNEKEKK